MKELLKMYAQLPLAEQEALDDAIMDKAVDSLESLVEAVDLATTYFAEQPDLIKVEVDYNVYGFNFRATLGDYSTPWASYATALYIGGFVVCTEFFVGPDEALKPIKPDRFLELTLVR